MANNEMEMEVELEVTLKAKVRFTAVKAEPDTWGYHGGEPGHPAYIEDLGVVSLIFDRIATPIEHDKNGNLKMEEREMPINYTIGIEERTLDNEIHFAVLGAIGVDEWTERCLEHATEQERG